jgi:uncharacterized membrane protein YphA (DoxX/SURF4 family)
MSIVCNLCRIIVGIVFIYSGFVKGVDPLGSTYKFIEYFNAAGLGSMDVIALIGAFVLSLAEFIIGVALLLNLCTRTGSLWALIFMLVFTPLTLLLAFTNPVSDCGCFGDALTLTHWQSFWKNIVLLCLAWVTYSSRRSYRPVLPVARQVGLLFLMAIYMLGISLYSYNTLPILDFRPYAVGNNILEKMQAPEGEEPNQYEITLFYKHVESGEVKAFTEEDYPWQDTAWVHERTEQTLVKRGYLPPIHDFSIDHPRLGEITREVLEDNNYTLLVVTRRLDEITRETQAKINRLAYHALERGYRVYGLTSSSCESTRAFSERHGVPYDICPADDTQLKTMIRSNPGILVLQKGTIIGKWSGHDIPEVKDIEHTDLVTYCIHELQSREENLLLCTLFFLFWGTYLLFPRRKKRDHRRRSTMNNHF